MGWLRRCRVWRVVYDNRLCRRRYKSRCRALHEVGGVANNGFGRFLGDRAGGINVGKVVVVGTEYAAGHTFVFVVAQTSAGGRCDFFLEGFGS